MNARRRELAATPDAEPAKFKIELHVPMPPSRRAGGAWPFLDMPPGASFLVECEPGLAARRLISRLMGAARNFSKQNGGRDALRARGRGRGALLAREVIGAK